MSREVTKTPFEDYRDATDGESETEISVDISYQILRQVSAQLYTNPRRAVEELVCNSYDAGATRCFVHTPSSSDDPLMVLDNGQSMDLDGLEWLWTVARSPKEANTNNGERVDNNRKQIGKFGIGKLAAFALGNRLTHIAHVNGVTRLISVDKGTISEAESEEDQDVSFPVHRLEGDSAKEILEPHLQDLPNPWENDWESWTLALVEDVDEENTGQSLKSQYLKGMIRTSIPLSTQFIINLNGKKVPPREPPEDEIISTDITSAEFIDRLEKNLKSFWKTRGEISEEEEVPADLYTCEVTETASFIDVDQTEPALLIPVLGPVSGSATIYESTLTTRKRDERGFVDHGFRVTVKGKLLNRHDPLFGVSQRSHKFWNRFLAEVEVPGLDDAILVQRNDVNENKVETLLTRRLLKSLFNYTRGEADELMESEEYRPKSFGERLNMLSPFGAPEAIEGLAGGYPSEGVESVDIKPVTKDSDDPPVTFDSDDEMIFVNEEHPLFQAMSEQYGYSNFRKTFGEVLAGNLLTNGFYRTHGVDRPLLEAGLEIYDDVLRSAASYFRDETEFIIDELMSTSFETDEVFEKAIVAAFRNMKLATRRFGAANYPDGVIEIPIAGEPNYRVSIEAKGKKNEGDTVDHNDAPPSTVNRQREEMDCEHAVIIARDFQLDGNHGNEKSALLREVNSEEQVSLLNLDSMEKMLRLHRERMFSHSEFIKILENEEHPSELPSYIESLWEELPDPGIMRVILEAAWNMQRTTEMRPSAGAITTEARVQEVVNDRNDVIEIIRVLGFLTGKKVRVYENGEEFQLTASPDAILKEVKESEGIPENAKLDEF